MEQPRRLARAVTDEECLLFLCADSPLATVIRTSSGDRKIPIVTSKGEAAWIDEGGQFPESDDSFGQTSIGAYLVGHPVPHAVPERLSVCIGCPSRLFIAVNPAIRSVCDWIGCCPCKFRIQKRLSFWKMRCFSVPLRQSSGLQAATARFRL